MVTWTQEQLKQYEADRKVQNPQPEQPVPDESVGEKTGAGTVPRRIAVRIKSYRKRLLDPDNLTGGAKYLVDGIRHAGLIPDDRPQDIVLEVTQEQVNLTTQERTEIEIV